ncbi:MULTISPECIES: MFS transporter [Dyadobacter]|uniref:MFS transporter n=1 Tax=Dyadobacter chenhuakuii TaxID=2909339 RepID=A0ABY4XNY4_9BACT|nr:MULTISPECIES: MFS transporter [Dyadobacter]MCF2494811.1 MFS transporter [Dyadobacter chenhuakuii]MCF2519110.1 MFS transporter [Dyadobacter sp. CY351]USJ31869.1 MFS transporter [Dyadobacter chenhuakuii]
MKEEKSITTTGEPRWIAVYSISLAVAGLITSEFLPVSILTPIARDLHVTEGMAGQAISVTALIAMFSSLFTAILTKKIDRRWVLLSFSVLQIISNILVSQASSFAVLMAGRVLLGIAVGGFWAMSTATTMRLVPQHLISKALSIVFAAVSFATVLAAPLGSFLDGIIGWRNVFMLVSGIGVIALVWQALVLPPMPPSSPSQLHTLVSVFRRRDVKRGMLGVTFSFAGYAIFFTYLRPLLENITHVPVAILTTILLFYGAANFFGAIIARFMIDKNLSLTMVAMSFLMSIVTALLIFLGGNMILASLFIAVWGFAFGSVQVGWPTWITLAVPDEAESGGSVLVATTQLAITLGAGLGGLVFDHIGIGGTFGLGSLVWLCAAWAIWRAMKGRVWKAASASGGMVHL